MTTAEQIAQLKAENAALRATLAAAQQQVAPGRLEQDLPNAGRLQATDGSTLCRFRYCHSIVTSVRAAF